MPIVTAQNIVTNKTMYMSDYQTVNQGRKQKLVPVINPFPSTMIPSIFRLPYLPHSWPPSPEKCSNIPKNCLCEIATRPLNCKLGGNDQARWTTDGLNCIDFASDVMHS